jgi:hypothetical protein
MKIFIKISNNKLLILKGLFVLFLLSCEGPEGPKGSTGPVGLPGAQGQAGTAGPTGPVGNEGIAGLANVVTYPWTVNTWTKFPDNTTHDTIPVSGITANSAGQDLILTYWKASEAAISTTRLPTTLVNPTTGQISFKLDYLIIPGGIYAFHAVPISTSTVADGFPNSLMRCIIIRGGNNGRMDFNIDFDNYEEVCMYFGIEP